MGCRGRRDLLWCRMARRSIVWVKEDPLGAEFADVDIARGRLTAIGVAIGSSPLGYRLEYKLETLAGYVTSGLVAVARGDGWQRKLDLRRLRSGRWTARTSLRGQVDLPPPGGGMPAPAGGPGSAPRRLAPPHPKPRPRP